MNHSTIDRAINTYGAKNQIIVAIEEMSELTKELCKNIRGERNIKHITEELADVHIMLQQVRRIYGIEAEAVEEVIEYKLKRLERRMKDDR